MRPRAQYVSMEEWNGKVCTDFSHPNMTAKWLDLHEAIDILLDQPVGGRAKVEAGSTPAVKRKRLHEYARRNGLGLRSYIVHGWIYCFSTRNDFGVKSHERGNLASDSTTTNSAGGVQPTKPAQALSRRAQ